MSEEELPTPQEIAERCAEIQANWTAEEKRSRLSGNVCLTKFKTAGVVADARSALNARLSQEREKQRQRRAERLLAER